MYESFFGLRERPFDLAPNPRYLVLTDVHREALSNLEYAISSRKGVTLLIGEAGSGKTTLIRAAIERQPTRVHCIHLNNPTLTRPEFVALLAERFGLSREARHSKAALLVELEALLVQPRRDGESTVLIVDEAQSLPLDLFEELRLLANIETDAEKLISLILAGQPELAARLNNQDLRQMKQRIALRCELRALTLQETAAYVAGRIRAGGGAGAQIFTRDAVTKMFTASRGTPRVINVLADNALLTSFAHGCRPVTADVITEVCRDFDLETGPDNPGEARAGNGVTPVHPTPPLPASVRSGRILDLVSHPAKEDDPREAAGSDRWASASGWRRLLFDKRSAQR